MCCLHVLVSVEFLLEPAIADDISMPNQCPSVVLNYLRPRPNMAVYWNHRSFISSRTFSSELANCGVCHKFLEEPSARISLDIGYVS